MLTRERTEAEVPVAPADGLPHAPALDGLRGLAAAAVVGYHLGLGWLKGGFLGVSLFFTLSGYLITNLLLAERRATGGTSLPGFWARRARRLLPAAFAGIALAILATAVAGSAYQLHQLRGDVLGAVLYAANWRFILGHNAYAANYQAPSALLHYWSLAIEEQAYVVLPLLFVVLTRRAASTRRFRIGVAVLMLASVTAALVIRDPNRAYFGTDTRSFELLAGAALALAVGFPGTVSAPRIPARVAGAVAVVGVVGTAVMWATVHETSTWLTKGGLWGVSALSCALLVGALAGGRLSRGLSGRPLVALGRRSYGVYVYHWPLFLLISAGTIGWHGLALDVARVGATGVVAAASFRWLEQPIRRGTWPSREHRSRLLVLAPLVAGSLVIAAVAGASEAASRSVARPSHPVVLASQAVPVLSTASAATALPPPRRILFMGDSLMQEVFPTLNARLRPQGTTSVVIGGGGQSLMAHDAAWVTELGHAVSFFDPDVVVLESCCGNFKFDPTWIGPGGTPVPDDTPAFWAEWRRLAVEATEVASSHGAVVLWVLGPPTRTNGWYGPVDARIPLVNQVYRGLVACDPSAALVDWSVLGGPGGTYAAALPDASGDLVTIRDGDGFHFTAAGQDLQARVALPAISAAWAADGGRAAPWRGTCP